MGLIIGIIINIIKIVMIHEIKANLKGVVNKATVIKTIRVRRNANNATKVPNLVDITQKHS
ncbi:MAG: hypothetical protein QXY79_01325 [Candidatus Methanomethylicia archaeon]